jgi:hypothetical protein
MTTTAQRFTLDEDKAREWLQPEGDGGLPEITEDWEPLSTDNEIDIYNLVHDAGEAGIIGKPDDYDLDFEYVDDGDGGYYQFVIRIGVRLKLTSRSEEMRKLGERDATGTAAALAILREAVETANTELYNLDEYVASRR